MKTQMKRPFAVIGFSVLSAMTAAFLLGGTVVPFLALAFLFPGLFSLFFCKISSKAKTMAAVFLACAAAFGRYLIYNGMTVKPALSLAGQEAEVTGLVCQGQSVYLQTDSVDLPGAPQNVRVKLYLFGGETLSAGDPVSCRLHFDLPSEQYRDFYRRDNIFLTATVQSAVSVPEHTPHPVRYAMLKTREFLFQSVSRSLPDSRGDFLKAMLLGDKSGLSPEIRRDFNRSGISHLFSVSGLHLSVLVQFLLMLLAALRLPEKVQTVLSALFVAAFMALTGFPVSVLRAGIMLLLTLFGKLIFRRTETVNSAGFAAFLIILFDPVSALNGGLWLSLSSTCGIALFSSPLQKRLLSSRKAPGRIVTVLAEMISVSVCGYLSSLPVLILLGMELPLLGIFTNILVQPVIWLTLVLALLITLFSLASLLLFAAKGLGALFGFLLLYIRKIAGLISALPFSVLSRQDIPLFLWLAGCAAAALILLLLRKYREYGRHFLALCVLSLFTAFFSHQLLSAHTTEITLFSGGGILVSFDQTAVLCDLPQDRRQADEIGFFLEEENIDRLGLAVSFTESLSGVSELLEKTEIKTLILPEEKNFSYQKTGIDQLLPLTKLKIELSENRSLEIFKQEKGGACLLQADSVCLLSFFGECDILSLPENFLMPDFILLPEKEKSVQGLSALQSGIYICNENSPAMPDGVLLTDMPTVIRCRKNSYVCYRKGELPCV